MVAQEARFSLPKVESIFPLEQPKLAIQGGYLINFLYNAVYELYN